MSRVRIFDVESYWNYCLIGFIDPETGAVTSAEAEGADKPFSLDDREWMRSQMKKYQTVGFNTINYDNCIVYGAIKGLTPRRLKRMTNRIINDKVKYWDIEEEFGITIPRNLDHIDLIEVAPGRASLKIYNGRMHGKRMQDLPIEPEKWLTPDEIEATYEYWKNDLDATVGLWKGLKKQLDLRAEMSREYKVDVRSKSDAQVAEAVIKVGIEKILGKKPVKPKFQRGQRYRYNIPDYIEYGDDPQLNNMLDEIYESWFMVSDSGKMLMPSALADLKIKIGESTYTMGIGGLHSTEECVAIVAGPDEHLFDRDVASFYPRIILNLKLFPKHLGKAFLKVYEGIVTRRLKAKAAAAALGEEIDEKEKALKARNGPSPLLEEAIAELKERQKKHIVEAEGLKITINGSFGKLGSVWSILFAPDLLIQTTITGQLALLMLIHRLERRGIPVVSGNTDGIIVRCPKTKLAEYLAVVKQWEKDTGFETEENEYSAVYSANVNNYIAIYKKDGKAKRKGWYAVSGLEAKKNPTNEICSDAVTALITKGTPLSKTIKECTDIRKFLTVRTVKGGATKDGVYLGKAIRWYKSTSTETAIHYAIPNKTGNHNKVPKSDGGMPLMKLPDEFPSDVNYAEYIRQARLMLIDIGYNDDLIGKRTRKKKILAEYAEAEEDSDA